MGLSRSSLCPSRAPFHEIVLRAVATLVDQITLPVTFRTWENFRTVYMQFEVADFEMTYNVFLGRLALTKFMAIPHYVDLVLKMPGPNGVITIKGDVKCAYDYNSENCETIDGIMASVELQELKRHWSSPTWTRSCLRPRRPSSRRTHLTRRSHSPQMNPQRLLI
jgi:hypothetical protein